ncbi:MAG: glycosyltransferase family 2 protein [Actinomycetes bacterium]
MSTVAVCVATLQRPVGLAALLASIAELEVPADVRLRVVVVDNDDEGSARRTVDQWRARIPGEVRYEVEARRGISYARNTGVRSAGDADWLAFVDDDEVVTPGWLREMLRVAEEYEADVVTGTVLPRFSEPPPAWVEGGRFFERPRFATGTRLPYARTSNALVAARLLTGSQAPFDERLARTGGEDTHFFQRVRLAGGRMVWADDAVVEETVPVSRIQPAWLLRREYRRGNTLSLCLRDLEWSRRRVVKRVGAAVVHAALGVATAASGLLRGKATLLRGAQRVAFAGGLLTGLTGRAYQEYEQIHGF